MMNIKVVGELSIISETPKIERVPCMIKAKAKPVMFATAQPRPEVMTVLLINTKFGPGETSTNITISVKERMSDQFKICNPVFIATDRRATPCGLIELY